ncbi:MAG: 4Fe-4S dicluster domain-containing protein [Actinobacteria bacterium]|nr:4Fe-4S dicluster domain-containing protein [Actinomycetota bacterium]
MTKRTNNSADKILNDILDYIEPKIYNCYQCGKCTAGCPLSDVFEYKPNQIIRLVQSGRIDSIIKSNSIFLCLSCEICSSRCPQDVHIATIMNFIRNEAWKADRFKIKSIARFYKTFLRIVGTTGRSFEPGLLMSLNFLSGRLFNDMDLALDILKKRKIRLLPEFIKGRKHITKIIKKYM